MADRTPNPSVCLYCDRKARPVMVAGEPRCDLHYTSGATGRLPATTRRMAQSRGKSTLVKEGGARG